MFTVFHILDNIKLRTGRFFIWIYFISLSGSGQSTFYMGVVWTKFCRQRVTRIITAPQSRIAIWILCLRVSSLNHKSVYYPMEQDVVKKVLFYKFYKIIPVERGVIVKFYPDCSHCSDNVKDRLFFGSFPSLCLAKAGGYDKRANCYDANYLFHFSPKELYCYTLIITIENYFVFT